MSELLVNYQAGGGGEFSGDSEIYGVALKSKLLPPKFIDAMCIQSHCSFWLQRAFQVKNSSSNK